ncbi:hypothetical protein ACLOJK_037671 [Asimina triloba]
MSTNDFQATGTRRCDRSVASSLSSSSLSTVSGDDDLQTPSTADRQRRGEAAGWRARSGSVRNPLDPVSSIIDGPNSTATGSVRSSSSHSEQAAVERGDEWQRIMATDDNEHAAGKQKSVASILSSQLRQAMTADPSPQAMARSIPTPNHHHS